MITRFWQLWYSLISEARIRLEEILLKLLKICALAQSSIAIYQVKEGLGRYIQYVEPIQIKNLTRGTYITILFNITGTTLVRISVCLFVLQLLPFTERRSRW